MSKRMAGIIIAYGALLAILGVLHRRIAPETGNLTVVSGVCGGVIAIVCGVIACLRSVCRVWIILTVAIAAFILMAQTVGSWGQSSEKRNLNEALLHTVMFVITAAMLKYTMHGERPPGFFS